jgi:hypothetical protein
MAALHVLPVLHRWARVTLNISVFIHVHQPDKLRKDDIHIIEQNFNRFEFAKLLCCGSIDRLSIQPLPVVHLAQPFCQGHFVGAAAFFADAGLNFDCGIIMVHTGKVYSIIVAFTSVSWWAVITLSGI